MLFFATLPLGTKIKYIWILQIGYFINDLKFRLKLLKFNNMFRKSNTQFYL